MYLPKTSCEDDGWSSGFVNLNKPHEHLEAGQWVAIDSQWTDNIPILARVGGAIPVGRDVQTVSGAENRETCPDLPEDDRRGVEIFPPEKSWPGRTYRNTWYEDDGISARPNIAKFTLSYSSREETVAVELEIELNGYELRWKHLSIILPVRETRMVVARETKSG
ncbi:hypothetical protein LTR16_007984 [Cryomyces antarcticus]|uniref:Uncharacterized protein n=1 Tax=Cryomyces antarcticus TaxID=329879 RepID=A0ABR0M3V4_9PEZI|nr:hypothetical protein LTR16_007984 [Cryomyces antarcticus]